jgi:hypothetical protein
LISIRATPVFTAASAIDLTAESGALLTLAPAPLFTRASWVPTPLGIGKFRMQVFALIVALLVFICSPAIAAGIDSRTYTCARLHALIAANGFVFISSPAFGDFVVANAYYCGGGERPDFRSVPTSDTPECAVIYCASRSGNGGD